MPLKRHKFIYYIVRNNKRLHDQRSQTCSLIVQSMNVLICAELFVIIFLYACIFIHIHQVLPQSPMTHEKKLVKSEKHVLVYYQTKLITACASKIRKTCFSLLSTKLITACANLFSVSVVP